MSFRDVCRDVCSAVCKFFLERERNKERASAAVLAWLQCVGGSVRLWVFAARMAAQSSTEDVLMESAGTPTELPSPVMKDQGKDDESLEWYDEDGPKQCLTHGYISDGSQDSDVGFIHKSYSGRRMVSPMTTTMLKHHDSDDSIMHDSLAHKAWPLVQRYLDECREKQATMHIEKCLKGHMMAKWARGAEVTPPSLVSSSTDD